MILFRNVTKQKVTGIQKVLVVALSRYVTVYHYLTFKMIFVCLICGRERMTVESMLSDPRIEPATVRTSGERASD